VRPVEGLAYEAVVPLYTTRKGLERWVGASARSGEEPLVEGAAVAFDLGDGLSLDGRVLAAAPHELLLSWPETGGVLGLKAFKAGPQRAVALDWSAWKAGDRTAEVERWMAAAVARLAAEVAAGAPSPAER